MHKRIWCIISLQKKVITSMTKNLESDVNHQDQDVAIPDPKQLWEAIKRLPVLSRGRGMSLQAIIEGMGCELLHERDYQKVQEVAVDAINFQIALEYGLDHDPENDLNARIGLPLLQTFISVYQTRKVNFQPPQADIHPN